ncbi:MAG: 4'-phosphopantetheinyl transferase superfamily protein [Cyclobacteriaceae bacterium]
MTFKTISSHASYGYARISQSLDELKLLYGQPAPSKLENYHPNKQAEFYASRILMKSLCEEIGLPFNGIEKDEHDKPHLIARNAHISISHAYPYIVCMIDKLQPCGIDIETPREQLIRIKRKFLNENEQEYVKENLELLCQYWCMKEALYKIHGRKNLSLSCQLNIVPIDANLYSGSINENKTVETYNLKIEFLEGYFMAYNL